VTEAPFIPTSPETEPLPPAPWKVFRVKGFLPLLGAQVVSSLGDWIGLIAILAIAARVSNSGTAVGLVMVARMLPGLILAPLGGVLVDRWNRRGVMITCDIGRAALLASLPFFANLTGLVVLSFCIEVLTLMWGPAKDASVPNIVTDKDQLAAANSLSLAASYGTFPLGAIMFAVLAGVATQLGHFHSIAGFEVGQESLAIWFDSFTFLVSALLISRLHLPETDRATRPHVDLTQTWRDLVEGMRFIRNNPMVRGVMIGLAGGLAGGGAIIPLGPVLNREVLHNDSAGFGLLMTALGIGAALGVVTLLAVQRRLPRETVFTSSVVVTGVAIAAVASVATLTPALVIAGAVGAGAGCGYVTGFTVLQESVSDDMRGRTFATLYTVVRLCLLLSLTVWPFVAGILGAISRKLFDGGVVDIGSVSVALPGVRLALWLSGAVTIASGFAARRRMRKAREPQSAA
jgi:dTMP kinase